RMNHQRNNHKAPLADRDPPLLRSLHCNQRYRPYFVSRGCENQARARATNDEHAFIVIPYYLTNCKTVLLLQMCEHFIESTNYLKLIRTERVVSCHRNGCWYGVIGAFALDLISVRSNKGDRIAKLAALAFED